MTQKEREYRFLLEIGWRVFLLGVFGFGFSSVVLGNLPIVQVVSPDLPGALVNAGRLATLAVMLAYLTFRLKEYEAETTAVEAASDRVNDANRSTDVGTAGDADRPGGPEKAD
ncbi:hypothetical protein [Haloarchaeobius sp. TZWWS8]|uniref:hypothetical protein n=1 Tax=Haloarchaeobius sp. TZWWS8 TaxID=3446121 RepID=UPI003EBB3A15